MSLIERNAPDGLYQFPTLAVNRSQTVHAASYRLLNIIAGVLVVLDTATLAVNAQLTVYNTSLAYPIVSCSALMSGQSSIAIPPGKKLYLTWTGMTYVAELENVTS